MDSDKLQRQLNLEHEAVELGITAYRKRLQEDELTNLPVGARLLVNTMTPLIEGFKSFKTDLNQGRFGAYRKFFNQFEDETLAYITARHCINAVGHRRKGKDISGGKIESIQHSALSLAAMLKDHIEYTNFKIQHPGYLHVLEKNLNSSHAGHRKTVIMFAKRKLGVDDQHWKEKDRLQIGIKCIEIFIETTGLVQKVLMGNPPTMILTPTDKALNWIETQHGKCELLSPVYMPMIIPPVKWDACFGGGFLTSSTSVGIAINNKLIKTNDVRHLNDHDMPIVYHAINTVQETAWRINKRVYEVMKEVWAEGTALGGIPSRNLEDLPAKTWSNEDEFQKMKAENPNTLKDWKRKATAVYDRRFRTKSKRTAMAQKLWLAEKFLNEEEIFFVWSLDWRGRMYPVQSFVNPQADDSGKALIEFARGVKLGEDGAYWLAVHLANCAGVDKVSFDDRVKWVKDNEKLIIDSALNPLDGERFWAEADDAYLFLAACFEWEEYKRTGNSFMSHLPIGMDGTCNGLQNFSAMLLDEKGGAEVNLIPGNKPRDIYSTVAKRVSQYVEQDAAAGNENAKLWVGKIDRKIAKRNVMTYVYGAKRYGFKDQLMSELSTRDEELRKVGKESKYLNTDDNFKPALYLADRMYTTIGEVVVAAQNAMEWLQEVAKVASKADTPIHWTTPAGFKPIQRYFKTRTKKVATFWGGVRLQLALIEGTNKMDSRKQSNGIAPNFVHSLDASHLMLTIKKCTEAGIKDFAMIHDSYGTHAGNITKLNSLLREAFIEQYSSDVLANFKKEVEEQLPEELRKEIPDLPRKGSLDLQAVRDSKYFFN